jgi:glutamate racemase
MKAPRIMIFDSGVGGLSIATEIRQLIPAAKLIFAADNEAYPYGTKGELELANRIDYILSRFIGVEPADILIVGCNSASTIILPHLRQHLSIPVVGVVPAIKPAAKASKTKVIGVLATPGTIKRSYTEQLIKDFAGNCQVILQGSSLLVDLAEDKLRGRPIVSDQLRPIIDELLDQPYGEKLDTVVLACTHFPLLKSELASTSSRGITWVDSGSAVANRTRDLLQGMGFDTSSPATYKGNTEGTALFSLQTASIGQLQDALDDLGFKQVTFIE